jgi:Protein of unknown function (DUF3572)
MQSTSAETLALKGLAFLARDPEQLLRFLTATGVELDHLRQRAEDPELLAAVLDFLLAEEALLLDFSASEGLDAMAVRGACRALPGAGGDGAGM